ncbi:YbaB/EbfC family nucleoid-associated protein [Mycoplasmatota bacterium]|nr:YbaB/EbfC family nucleoid-associated protein [Mycoplasmatota bacterium]
MNPNMLNKLKKMQKQMMEAQEALEAKEFFGKASGVMVVVQGTRQVVDVQINPEMLEEAEMLQDAILLATNDALKQIEKEQEETMGQFTGGMGGGLGF